MGGGVSRRQAYYGTYRKVELSMTAIQRTGLVYGVRLTREGIPRVRVVSEKMWNKRGFGTAYAFYRDSEDTFYIRRKYFAGRKTQKTITHELLHSYSGPHKYWGAGSVSGYLEEGPVEYVAQGTRTFGYKGRGRAYAGGIRVYAEQRAAISLIMGIVGRKKVLKMWQEGFWTVNETPAVKTTKTNHREAVHDYEQKRKRAFALKSPEATWGEINQAWLDVDAAREKTEKTATMVERARTRNRNYLRLARSLDRKGYKKTAQTIREYYDEPTKVEFADIIEEELREKKQDFWEVRIPPEVA